MPTALTNQQILDRFNSLVRTPIVTSLPPTFSSAAPPNPAGRGLTDGDLGPAAEPVFSTSALPAGGEGAITAVFYILHHWAMQLTRIRRAKVFFIVGWAANTVPVQATVALKSGYELYFPIPTVPASGTSITSAVMDNFLSSLKVAVQKRRDGTEGLFHNIIYYTACHSNCHSNCHGSRGRR
jgi:hypothetical protein